MILKLFAVLSLTLALLVIEGCAEGTGPMCVESKGKECATSDECADGRQCLEYQMGKFCMYQCIEDSDCYQYGLDVCTGQTSTEPDALGFCAAC
jgi:hypothetical protein